jgi:hypothetical protein
MAMAKAKIGRSLEEVRASGERIVGRLIARSRAEVLRDVSAVKKELRHRARDLERRVVRQFHAATVEQVRRLERRIAKLERALTELGRRPGPSGSQAA